MRKTFAILLSLLFASSIVFGATLNGLTGMTVLPDANIMDTNDIQVAVAYTDYSYGSEITGSVGYGILNNTEVALSGAFGEYDSYTLAAKYQIPLTIPAKMAVGAHMTQNDAEDIIYGGFAAVTLPVFDQIYETGAPGLNVTLGMQYAREPLLKGNNYKQNYLHFYVGSTFKYGPLELSIDGRLGLNNVDSRDGFSAKVAYTLPVYGVQFFAGVNNSNIYNTVSKLGLHAGTSYTF